MGRLWDDHFRYLGHPPKFCRVQDTSSGNNSPYWYHFRVIFMKHHSTITKYQVFSKQWHSKRKKMAPARMPTNSRPEWGSTPRWSLFKIRELANSKLFWSKINQFHGIFIYFGLFPLFGVYSWGHLADSGLVMVDGACWDDFFEQNRSWDDFGTIISDI